MIRGEFEQLVVFDKVLRHREPEEEPALDRVADPPVSADPNKPASTSDAAPTGAQSLSLLFRYFRITSTSSPSDDFASTPSKPKSPPSKSGRRSSCRSGSSVISTRSEIVVDSRNWIQEIFFVPMPRTFLVRRNRSAPVDGHMGRSRR